MHIGGYLRNERKRQLYCVEFGDTEMTQGNESFVSMHIGGYLRNERKMTPLLNLEILRLEATKYLYQ